MRREPPGVGFFQRLVFLSAVAICGTFVGVASLASGEPPKQSPQETVVSGIAKSAAPAEAKNVLCELRVLRHGGGGYKTTAMKVVPPHGERLKLKLGTFRLLVSKSKVCDLPTGCSEIDEFSGELYVLGPADHGNIESSSVQLTLARRNVGQKFSWTLPFHEENLIGKAECEVFPHK